MRTEADMQADMEEGTGALCFLMVACFLALAALVGVTLFFAGPRRNPSGATATGKQPALSRPAATNPPARAPGP